MRINKVNIEIILLNAPQAYNPEVRLVPLLNNDELISIKLSIVKDLEKTLKTVYEHRYRNILSKIVSNKKRFVKRHMAADVSEDTCRYGSISIGLINYLINIFDVFGESAVLNAKKIFEENGLKWGKKLKRKFNGQSEADDVYLLIKSLYIGIPGADYLETSQNGLAWHFSKLNQNNFNEGFVKLCPGFYDIKEIWIRSFINAFMLRSISIIEKETEDDNEIITNIIFKEEKHSI